MWLKMGVKSENAQIAGFWQARLKQKSKTRDAHHLGKPASADRLNHSEG